MTTTELTDEALQRSADNEPVPEDVPTPAPMTKAVAAAYDRAKKAGRAQDAESTKQVAECRRKREGVVSARAPQRGRQSALVDF